MKGIIKEKQGLSEEYKKKNAFTGFAMINPTTAMNGNITLPLSNFSEIDKYARAYRINFTITSENNAICDVWCENNPTGNCQLVSIIYAFQLASFENGAQMLKTMVSTYGKYLALCDINQRYSENFEKLFSNKEAILFKNNYKSSNNSSMCIYLINTKFI